MGKKKWKNAKIFPQNAKGDKNSFQSPNKSNKK